MPPAARITDQHVCPNAGGPVVMGAVTVFIGHQPAARMSDALVCGSPGDIIAAGSPTVNISGQPASRLGDPTTAGGTIARGCPTVNIGPTVQGEALSAASSTGAPFCEECERAEASLARQG